jgi:PAS domain S-box-containing protein
MEGPTREVETARLLLEAARYLGETLDLRRIYERFREIMAEAIPHDGVVVSSYDAEDGIIRCDYAWVDGELLDVAIFPPIVLQPTGGMQSEVIRTGRPLLTNDVAARVRDSGTYYDVDREGTMRKVPDEGPPQAQAAMMVPIKQEGAVVGVVQLMSDHDSYSAEQLELAEGIIAQLGAAVRNGRLHEEALELEATAAAARAAAEERERAAQVLEAVGDGIFFVTDEGRITFWNAAAETITGRSAAEVRGRTPVELGAEWETLSSAVPAAERNERPRSVTLPVELDDREAWLSFVAVRTRGGVVYAFRDMTSEQQLDDAKHEFVATVSHELRTPMTAVLGAAKTLLRDDVQLDDDVRRQLLEMIAAQAERLTTVTETLLLAGRLDRGEVTVDKQRLDVDAVVTETVDALEQGLAPPLRIERRLGAPGDALGDSSRLQQVIMNLLDNATRYATGGEVIVVETSRTDQRRVRIEVTDQGVGIAEGERDRIFEKFYRSPASRRLAPGGNGLGLYICRELLERMDGTITVSSPANAGATFAIELPAA